MIKVVQLTNDKGNPAANQFVLFSGNCIYFQSYDSVVAEYNKITGDLTLGQDYNYSKTTMKHLLIFIRNYTQYTTMNAAKLKQMRLAGEIIKVDYNFNNVA